MQNINDVDLKQEIRMEFMAVQYLFLPQMAEAGDDLIVLGAINVLDWEWPCDMRQ